METENTSVTIYGGSIRSSRVESATSTTPADPTVPRLYVPVPEINTTRPEIMSESRNYTATSTSTTSTSTSTTNGPSSAAMNLYRLLTAQAQASRNNGNNGFSGVRSAPSQPQRREPEPDMDDDEDIIQLMMRAANVNGPSSNGGRSFQPAHPRIVQMSRNPDNVRPQFRGKVVCNLSCTDCGVLVCQRGMKAILLADTTVELFSTDCPPLGVQMVNDDYITRNCCCRIRDVACLACGNIVGYHVTQPCKNCLSSCNNGHFWMFHLGQVSCADRFDKTGSRMLWAQLPRADKEEDVHMDDVCR